MLFFFALIRAEAQQPSGIEYFFDTDPGFGNGTWVAFDNPSDTVISEFSIDVTGLSPGFHRLFIRIRDDADTWSIQEARAFYITSTSSLEESTDIVGMEYFVDSDPGIGQASEVPFESSGDSVNQIFSLPVAGLAEGFHRLFVRTQNTDGKWSLTEGRTFYVVAPEVLDPADDIDQIEYYVDNDPGIGLASNINFSTTDDSLTQVFNIPVSGVDAGFHIIGMRAKNTSGHWSVTETRKFYVVNIAQLQPSAPIDRLEYFFDNDPGFGLATQITYTPADTLDATANIDLSGMPLGKYALFVRARDTNGHWSMLRTDSITITNATVTLTALSGTSFCAGEAVQAQFTTSETFETGNTVALQLSNANGSFSSPLTLGEVTTSASGTVNGTLPSDLPSGSGYRLRVVASDPAVVSLDNGSDISITGLPSFTSTITGDDFVCTGTHAYSLSESSNFDFSWSVSPTATLVVDEASVNLTFETSGTYTLSVVASNVCGDSDALTLNIDVSGSPAPQVTPASTCGSGSVTLQATGAEEGNFRWYSTSDGATPIENVQSSSFTTPELTSSTTYFVAVVDGICESERTSVEASVYPIPSAPIGNPAERCGTGEITLEASGSTDGNYRWYDSETAIEPIAGEDNAVLTVSELTETRSYFVSIASENCESPRVEVLATILPAPGAITTSSEERCGPGSVTLTASSESAESYKWYESATAESPLPGEDLMQFETPSLTQTTSYFVSAVLGNCESERVQINAIVTAIPSQPEVEQPERCGPGSVTIEAAASVADSYRWYHEASSQTPIEAQTASTFVTDELIADEDYFVSALLGACESDRTAVQVSIREVPEAPHVSDASRCGEGEVSLTATGFEDGNYRWYADETSQTPLSPTSGSFTMTATNDITFFVSGVNVHCESNRAAISVSILPVPEKPVISISSSSSGLILASSANEGNQWFLNGEILSEETGNSISNAEAGGIYTVQVTRNGCESEMSEEFLITSSDDPLGYVEISPIPTSSTLSVKISTRSKFAKIQLINLTGSVVLSKEVSTSKGQIATWLNLDQMEDGLYLIRILHGSNAITRKVIKF